MANYSISNERFPGRYVNYQGEQKIWLGGTNYLAIGFHPMFQEKLSEGIKLFPQNWGSSRKNNLQIDLFEKFENDFSEKFPQKSVALCSSGMSAAQTALYFIKKNHPELIPNLAPFTHPALWMPQIEIAKGSYQDWTKNISNANHHLYCSDGIGAPIVQKFDLDWTRKTSKDSVIVIDESHRFGLMDINLDSQSTLIQTASLSKAFGIPAGIIIGPKDWINELKKDPFWVGSSPPNPAFLYASLAAEVAYKDQKERLKEVLALFDQSFPFEQMNIFNRVRNYPGISSSDSNLFQYLLDFGFLTNLFSYPNINDPALCKFIIHPMLKNEEITKLASILANYHV